MSQGSFGDFDPDKIGQKWAKLQIKYVEKDKSNVYRVLPPFGSLREANKIGQYWTVHYGFVKSKKGKSIPVACGKETRFENGKQVVVRGCPLCDKISAIENALKTLESQNNPANETNILTLKAKLETLQTDKKFYLNALSLEGSVVVLKISYKHMKSLEAEIKRLRKDAGFNAAGVTGGLYLDFQKSGNSFDTTFTVIPSMITTRDPSTGQHNMQYRTSDLSASDMEKISKDAKDLTTLFRTFSAEDLALIAKGDESTITRLFSNPVNEVEEEVADDESEELNAATADALKAAVNAPVNTATVQPVVVQQTVQTPVQPPLVTVQQQAPTPTVQTPVVNPLLAAQATLNQPLTTDQILKQFLNKG